MTTEEFSQLLSQGNWAAAIKRLDVVIQNYSGNGGLQDLHQQSLLVSLLLNRAFCNQKLQLYRKALKDSEEALAVDPTSVESLYRKGQVLVSLKKEKDALSTWHEALRLSTPNTSIWLILELHASIQDPQRVHRDYDSLRWAVNRMTNSRVWPGLFLMLVLTAALVTNHSFKVATTMAFSSHAKPLNSGESALLAKNSAANLSSKVSSEKVVAPLRSQSPSSPDTPPTRATQVLKPTVQEQPSSMKAKGKVSQSGGSDVKKGDSNPKIKTSKDSAVIGEEEVEIDCSAAQHKQSERCSTSMGKGVNNVAAAISQINAPLAIQMAVTHINNGKVQEAEVILDQVLNGNPKELGALVARGTAKALRRDLQGAINDFSTAIEVEPRYPDTWKRRGQARSAIGGHDDEALTDLQKAMDLMPTMGQDLSGSRAECMLERAMIFQKRRDYRRACQELKEAVKLQPNNHQMWNVMGLCSTSQGDIRDGVAAYEKAVKIKPDLKECWLNMAQALKEEGRTEDAERSFNKVLSFESVDAHTMSAYRVMAQMRQQKGDHMGAITILSKAIALKRDDSMIELLFQRAICYHALGYIKEAVQDYEMCLGWTKGNSSEEAHTFQYLSFYQKEMALYWFHSLGREVRHMCQDAELQPLFKELWCKKGPPTAELIAQYLAQPPVPSLTPMPPPRPSADKISSLTKIADRFGRLLQNQHQGFLPNARQQRAAGFAAIELGQAVRELLVARRSGNTVWVRSEGSSVQAGASGRHQFGWRDAMDIVVKWRQLAEPNDQVVWVDLLTRREFEQGFGSHTPMFTGQTKCVRYYMNFKRAFALHKQVLLRDGHAFNAQNQPIPCGSPDQVEAIKNAQTAEDMYRIINTDSWVVVHINSVSRLGKTMEGTRLTLVRVPNQPDAFEFSIRTPVTPPRWKEFDSELEAAWELMLQALLEGDQMKSANAIMTFAYYWYNFMPLARGTAACGYTTILSLFWTAGMNVVSTIPKDYQVDWEAILSQHPDDFTASVSKWLYPPAAKGLAGTDMGLSSGKAMTAEWPDVLSLPQLVDTLDTLRNRLEALNGDGYRRL